MNRETVTKAIGDLRSAIAERKKIIFGIFAAQILFLILFYNYEIGPAVEPWQNDLRFSNNSVLYDFAYFKQALYTFVDEEEQYLNDIHLQDDIFSHTGETNQFGNESDKTTTNHQLTIAVGLGITSKLIEGLNNRNVAEKFMFFHTFLPTFCATASPGYVYAFYLAYDHTDPFFALPDFITGFRKAFQKSASKHCSGDLQLSLHLVQCDHAGKPVWAQNDAMLEAYLDNADYYYRINDDTKLQTKDWTNIFINTLNSFNPKKLGVCGPNHSGGNLKVLTYDFVHRTHIDVLGFYYPRLMTDWWGDNWITTIYQPNRMRKVMDVTLKHTLAMGQRYSVNWKIKRKWKQQVLEDKKVINRYLVHLNSTSVQEKPNGRRIISMSLFGKNPVHTWGAIRNAQLTPVFFPGWRLRFYVIDPNTSSNEQWMNYRRIVPQRIINKLVQLGAEIVYVKPLQGSGEILAPEFWKYLVIDDLNVQYFLIRDVDSRVNDRDAYLVDLWLRNTSSSNTSAAMHCIRDHPMHAAHAIADGLWAGNSLLIRKALQSHSITQIIAMHISDPTKLSRMFQLQFHNTSAAVNNRNTLTNSQNFLIAFLYPLLSSNLICHDSVSCRKWNNSFPIKQGRQKFEYLGQKYNEHHELLNRTVWRNNQTTCEFVVTRTTPRMINHT